MATTHKPHSLKIHPDGASAVILPDVLNMALPLNPKIQAEMVASGISPLHAAINEFKPVLSGATFSIATFLDTVGVSGLCITAATNAGAVAYWQRFKACGTPDSSGHRSQQIKSGLLVPKTLSCDNRGDARITFELIIVKASGANAVIIDDAATLPTITVASARWTLGPCKINNVALADYTSLEIDFGNQVEAMGTASDIYDSRVSMRTHAPTIRLKGIDPTWFGSAGIPIGGAEVSASTDYIYLRKRSRDGDSFVGNATAEHILFTPAGLAGVSEAGRADAQRVSETELLLTLAVDGSGNNPLVIDTTAALP